MYIFVDHHRPLLVGRLGATVGSRCSSVERRPIRHDHQPPLRKCTWRQFSDGVKWSLAVFSISTFVPTPTFTVSITRQLQHDERHQRAARRSCGDHVRPCQDPGPERQLLVHIAGRLVHPGDLHGRRERIPTGGLRIAHRTASASARGSNANEPASGGKTLNSPLQFEFFTNTFILE